MFLYIDEYVRKPDFPKITINYKHSFSLAIVAL